jgi:hypothetical protein
MNIFDLFVYAAVALVIVIIFLIITQNFPQMEGTSSLIKKALDEARLDPNLGKLSLIGTLSYDKDTLMTADGVSPQGVLTSIECTNAELCCIRKSQQNAIDKCKKVFEWDYDFVKPIESRKTNTFVRCIDIDQINTCKVYIGSTPAQAEIESVEKIGENSQGNTEIKAILTNTGANTLANATATLTLNKLVNGKWIQTDYEQDSREIQILQSGEKEILYWEIKTTNMGEYQAKIYFEAKDAGFSEKTLDFNKTQNNFCSETTIGETVYNAENNTYEELHNCETCNYAYECANAWSKRDAQTTYYPRSKDFAYCVKTSAEGSC